MRQYHFVAGTSRPAPGAKFSYQVERLATTEDGAVYYSYWNFVTDRPTPWAGAAACADLAAAEKLLMEFDRPRA